MSTRPVNARRGSLGGTARSSEAPITPAEEDPIVAPATATVDPVQRKKIKERRGSVGNILLKQNHGPRVLKNSFSEISELSEASEGAPQGTGSGWDVMEDFLKAIRNISAEISPDDAAKTIIKETCALLNADRSTLFFVDAEANELILVIAKGANNIRIPIGNGLAGAVAQTGDSINIPDAYEDPRFSSAFDKSSGYRTRAVLAVAVRDPDGSIVAVLQCINKMPSGCFSDNDKILLEHMASHVGVVLRNAGRFESERSSKQKVNSLVEMVKMLHSGNTNTNSLIFTLSNRSHELVDADRCTLYLCDIPREQLVVMQGDLDFRFPITKGIAGFCASEGKSVVIDDAYEDKRFNKSMDLQSGYRTKSILCMPIFGNNKTVIGVLQLINKGGEEEVFDKQDLELMETLLQIAGPLLHRSKFFEVQDTSKAKPGKEVAIPRKSPRQKSRGVGAPVPQMASFGEEEEEDDEFN